MATDSSVPNDESDSTIPIINDDHPLVIKECFFEYYAFDINMSYFGATAIFSPASTLETRIQVSIRLYSEGQYSY
jgi:hypothetical protein